MTRRTRAPGWLIAIPVLLVLLAVSIVAGWILLGEWTEDPSFPFRQPITMPLHP